MSAQTRNSRWNRNPVLDDEGKPCVVRLTKHDIEIFKLLARYRYLSINDIHPFIGGNFKHLNHRLSLLSRDPNLFLKRPPQQRNNANANYSPLIYELDTKAVTLLSEHGIQLDRRHPPYSFVHELMACQIMASIELGVIEDRSARLIEWPEIVAKLPEKTRKLPSPHCIPVLVGNKQRQVRADWAPFGIERTRDKKTYIFFAGIEVDCGTEPTDASNADRSSIHTKLLSYAAIAEKRLYHSQFGFPNFFVPFITTTGARMKSMTKHLERLVETGRVKKSEAAIFLFNTFPSLTSHSPRQTVNGRMYTDAWQRIGFEPFRLTD